MIGNPITEFYDALEEPNQSVFLALRRIILDFDSDITEHFKWGLPFFCYQKKNFCYLWKDKKTQQPYLALYNGNKMTHTELISEDRKLIKILPISVQSDLPYETIIEILEEAKSLFKA